MVRLVSDSRSIQAEYRYNACGKVDVTAGADGLGNINPIRYRGYYYDAETGLYYVGNRYYDSSIARFISVDTTDILDVSSDLYDKNLYAYCDNNPIMRKDVSGELWISLAIGAGIGIAHN